MRRMFAVISASLGRISYGYPPSRHQDAPAQTALTRGALPTAYSYRNAFAGFIRAALHD